MNEFPDDWRGTIASFCDMQTVAHLAHLDRSWALTMSAPRGVDLTYACRQPTDTCWRGVGRHVQTLNVEFGDDTTQRLAYATFLTQVGEHMPQLRQLCYNGPMPHFPDAGARALFRLPASLRKLSIISDFCQGDVGTIVPVGDHGFSSFDLDDLMRAISNARELHTLSLRQPIDSYPYDSTLNSNLVPLQSLTKLTNLDLSMPLTNPTTHALPLRGIASLLSVTVGYLSDACIETLTNGDKSLPWQSFTWQHDVGADSTLYTRIEAFMSNLCAFHVSTDTPGAHCIISGPRLHELTLLAPLNWRSEEETPHAMLDVLATCCNLRTLTLGSYGASCATFQFSSMQLEGCLRRMPHLTELHLFKTDELDDLLFLDTVASTLTFLHLENTDIPLTADNLGRLLGLRVLQTLCLSNAFNEPLTEAHTYAFVMPGRAHAMPSLRIFDDGRD